MNSNGAAVCPVCEKKAQTTKSQQKIVEHIEKMNELIIEHENAQGEKNFFASMLVYCVKQLGGDVRVPASFINDAKGGTELTLNFKETKPLVQIREDDLDLLITLSKDRPRIIRP